MHGSQALISLILSLLYISISFAISPLLYLFLGHTSNCPRGGEDEEDVRPDKHPDFAVACTLLAGLGTSLTIYSQVEQ
jgi:hypothetical protein